MRKYILHRVNVGDKPIHNSRCAMALRESDPRDGFLIEISVIVRANVVKISAVAIMQTLKMSSRASVSKRTRLFIINVSVCFPFLVRFRNNGEEQEIEAFSCRVGRIFKQKKNNCKTSIYQIY